MERKSKRTTTVVVRLFEFSKQRIFSEPYVPWVPILSGFVVTENYIMVRIRINA